MPPASMHAGGLRAGGAVVRESGEGAVRGAGCGEGCRVCVCQGASERECISCWVEPPADSSHSGPDSQNNGAGKCSQWSSQCSSNASAAAMYGCRAAMYGCRAALYGCRAALCGCRAALYGCRAALYGCRAALYGCRAALYGCRAALYGPGCTGEGIHAPRAHTLACTSGRGDPRRAHWVHRA